MKDLDLTAVLERATADLPVADRSHDAWRRAQQVRRRRAAAVAGATVVLVVAGVAGASVWQRGDGDVRPPVTTETPTDDVAADADPVAWDPFTLPQEPRGTTVLPEQLDPPASAPSVLDSPLPAAVVAWPEVGQDLMLLGVDGAWRSVPATADALTGTLHDMLRPALSGDGRLLAFATDAGVRVVDVTTGHDQTLSWDSALAGPWDTVPSVRWMPGDDQLVVLHWKHTWLMGLDGTTRRAPFSAGYGEGLAVDQDGPVLLYDGRHNIVEEWQDGETVRTVPGPAWGNRWVARFGLMGFTGSPDDVWDRSGPVVLDAGDGSVVAAASIKDRSSVYSDNGYLTVLGFLDPETALLKVAPMDFRTMSSDDATWYLVAWDLTAGEFERLTEGDSRMAWIEAAPALMGYGSP